MKTNEQRIKKINGRQVGALNLVIMRLAAWRNKNTSQNNSYQEEDRVLAYSIDTLMDLSNTLKERL